MKIKQQTYFNENPTLKSCLLEPAFWSSEKYKLHEFYLVPYLMIFIPYFFNFSLSIFNSHNASKEIAYETIMPIKEEKKANNTREIIL